MSRLGMVIDLDRCNGCGACMVACAVENNVPPANAEATDRTGITWMRVMRVNNGEPYPANRVRFIPMMCQHCADTPCAQCMPAAGGGCRSRHGNHRSDASTLPRLPLLHGGLSLPCALLQLVGSGVAGGHGEGI